MASNASFKNKSGKPIDLLRTAVQLIPNTLLTPYYHTRAKGFKSTVHLN